jgi:hypothetical protein
MTSPNSQVANKILCIGGSTFNPHTPNKIRDALKKTNFLEEWAVFFVNHSYFKLSDPKNSIQVYKNKIISEWSGINVIFIDSQKKYSIQKNCVYILPDSGMYNQNHWLYAHFSINQNIPTIEIPTPQTSYQLLDTWISKNPNYACGNERNLLYLPDIDKVMENIANSYKKLNKIASLIICGLDGDGADGLNKIKNSGGDTAVQLPDECCNPIRQKTTSQMPEAAININPNHQIISLENTPGQITLSQWLSKIK